MSVIDEAGKAFNTTKDQIERMGDAAGKVASRAAEAAVGTGAAAANVVAGAAKDAYAAFGGKVSAEQEGNLRDAEGSYLLPEPVVAEAELAELDPLEKRWKKATKPGFLAKAGGKAVDMLPKSARDSLAEVANEITGKEFYSAALEIIAKGFTAIESQAAKMSVSPTYVVNRINRGQQSQKITDISEICLLRSYDVARIAGEERTQHLTLAFTEGAATGAPGFPAIPLNIALSMFLFFRAVQSIAMFYGYDVKADPSEMVIAGDVLMAAFGGAPDGPNGKVATGVIGKVMAISEAETTRQVVAKGWTAAANQGGIPLILTQMRALANSSAKKALIKAEQKSLEESVFSNVFRQIGKRLTQSSIKSAVPVVGGVIGAFFDTGLMDRVLTVADLFYHKRFVLEKDARVHMLVEGITFEEFIEEAEIEGEEG